MTYIKFGECLTSLLSILDISANRLSKAINVDSSLVNRWVNGKRIPGYDSIYIESITEYFAKNFLNSLQIQRLNELFLSACDNRELAGMPKEMIAKLLLEAQGYSMECKRRERINRLQKGQNPINDENPLFAINELTHSVALSKEDKIIFQIETILSAAVSLLEIAAQQTCENNETIYITYNNDMSLANQNRHLMDGLRNALLNAINKGWQVILLVHLNSNINRIISLIKFAKPLVKTGKFNSYYLNKYYTTGTGRENITVPGIGALSCFSTGENSEVNCAFYFRNEIAVEVFKNYYQMLIANHNQPLIKYYARENSHIFNQCLLKREETIGDRFLYKPCAGLVTLPENLYLKLLKKKSAPMMSCSGL